MLPDDVQALRAAVQSGLQPKYLFFWGHTGDAEVGPHVLSQWYPVEFTLDGVVYATAEHWMMAAKARLFGDDTALTSILAAKTPGEAKALGRGVRGFDGPTWNAAKMDIVVAGNRAKFGQHPDLQAYLQSTRDRVLVEASPVDLVWGIGWAAHAPEARDPSQWRGENLLGFALMRARSQLSG